MNVNPYAPPAAVVDDLDSRSEQEIVPPFFAVSVLKLAVLSLCSFGLYQLYWFYKNWQQIRDRDRSDISPFWRAFFPVLFCYSCFVRISKHGANESEASSLAAGPLATGWIIATISSRLPEPYWMISLLAGIFLLPVQAHANRLNAIEAPGHARNAGFGIWNWLTAIVGGGFLILVIIGTIVLYQ